MLKEVASTQEAEASDYVHFWAEGDRAKGEFHCSECGYRLTAHSALPACPTCSSKSWERSAWSPFTRGFAAER
jgi:rubrerythrin